MSKITKTKLNRSLVRWAWSKTRFGGFKVQRIVGYKPADKKFPLYHPKFKDVFAMVSEGQAINWDNGKNILFRK